MSEKLIQEQIRDINRKLDLILDETSFQRQSREAVNDLVDDVAVIGKDAFKQMVTQLDDAGIELDSEALRCLLLRLIRNIRSLGMVMETLESFTDLAKDVTPIVKQIGLDGVQKFYELEQKGYFELLNQLGKTFDQILSKYRIEDIQRLPENLVPVIDTLITIADPEILKKINAAAVALRDINTDEIENYSVLRMMKQLNKPELRKSLGFLMAFINNVSKTEKKSNKLN
jgi:uncharacterized protein YjgD (DUF1641 family)